MKVETTQTKVFITPTPNGEKVNDFNSCQKTDSSAESEDTPNRT
jgi:hypothetical protein